MVYIFGGDSNIFLAVEYKQVVADVVGLDSQSFRWPERMAARHFGVMNVLYADSRVKTRKPRDVDPRVVEIHDELWGPRRGSRMAGLGN
jgi:hypothetical protein